MIKNINASKQCGMHLRDVVSHYPKLKYFDHDSGSNVKWRSLPDIRAMQVNFEILLEILEGV
jgi:hypothetical protein